MNAFCSPKSIILSHLLYQVDGFGRQPGTPAFAEFEFSEESKALTMPAEDGAGPEDQERVLPKLNSAG